ncbi:unnamed protein product [Rotaria sordida]|uniref:Lipocalin/cytosolic fatty-acid binding domain-containing protein n=1 Tax=Rotaria sordida TaxID=392033 RepID=A0A819XIA4_9BILA|nr:unnamed protein product [Rotaria sordida]CAF0945924.1 unnamed protein product [Rotaria sordida]CAF1067120.1 unnamed protein product [Rotaria sordida]CAF1069635.1 unnamed protein product [Rotaria sordida]CAF4141953.1 unnamed protein product [Rotaria sordida]
MERECRLPAFSSLRAQQNFDLCRFLGTWYEIKWFLTGETSDDIWGDHSQLFDFQDKGKRRLIVYGQARNPNETNCFSTGSWSIDASNGARMILRTEDLKNGPIVNWPFLVLKTDYYHYALVYFCISKNYRQTNPCKERHVTIYSRQKTLAAKYLNPLVRYVDKNLCISPKQLITTPYQEKPCPAL